MATFSTSPFWAVVLAADRTSADPVALAAGVPCKALAPVGGRPMLLRVLDALSAAEEVGVLGRELHVRRSVLGRGADVGAFVVLVPRFDVDDGGPARGRECEEALPLPAVELAALARHAPQVRGEDEDDVRLVEGRPLEEAVERFSEALRLIRSALEQRDYVRDLQTAISDRFGDLRFRGSVLNLGCTATFRF